MAYTGPTSAASWPAPSSWYRSPGSPSSDATSTRSLWAIGGLPTDRPPMRYSAGSMERAELNGLLLRARGLAVLRGVLASEPARDFLTLLGLLAEGHPEPPAVADTFGRLWAGLAVEDNRLLPEAWQACLAGRLLDDENPFSLGAEAGQLTPAILEQ